MPSAASRRCSASSRGPDRPPAGPDGPVRARSGTHPGRCRRGAEDREPVRHVAPAGRQGSEPMGIGPAAGVASGAPEGDPQRGAWGEMETARHRTLLRVSARCRVRAGRSAPPNPPAESSRQMPSPNPPPNAFVNSFGKSARRLPRRGPLRSINCEAGVFGSGNARRRRAVRSGPAVRRVAVSRSVTDLGGRRPSPSLPSGGVSAGGAKRVRRRIGRPAAAAPARSAGTRDTAGLPLTFLHCG